jgi:hypothetical protein
MYPVDNRRHAAEAAAVAAANVAPPVAGDFVLPSSGVASVPRWGTPLPPDSWSLLEAPLPDDDNEMEYARSKAEQEGRAHEEGEGAFQPLRPIQIWEDCSTDGANASQFIPSIFIAVLRTKLVNRPPSREANPLGHEVLLLGPQHVALIRSPTSDPGKRILGWLRGQVGVHEFVIGIIRTPDHFISFELDRELEKIVFYETLRGNPSRPLRIGGDSYRNCVEFTRSMETITPSGKLEATVERARNIQALNDCWFESAVNVAFLINCRLGTNFSITAKRCVFRSILAAGRRRRDYLNTLTSLEEIVPRMVLDGNEEENEAK